MNWKNLIFSDNAGEFKLTHKTGNKFTVKIIKQPEEGILTIANPNWKLSNNEFVMTKGQFNALLELEYIRIISDGEGIG